MPASTAGALSAEEQRRKQKARRDEGSSKMGAKLLAGWRMLATTCAKPGLGCAGTPLMSSPADPTVVVCVGCEGHGGGGGGSSLWSLLFPAYQWFAITLRLALGVAMRAADV